MARGEENQGKHRRRKLITAAPPKYPVTGKRKTRDNKNKNTRERKQQLKQTKIRQQQYE
jgi:hypothetical protein